MLFRSTAASSYAAKKKLKRVLNKGNIQCIYIARMKDPWTLDSPRVLISKPEYEWERQWVNPDGSRTAYPIYVNEGPQFFHSKDNKTLILYYAASGSWSPYYCVGMLTADAESDLLDPASWTKSSVPVFQQSLENEVYGRSEEHTSELQSRE